MEQSGKTLSMLGNDRWKGGETHNGTLLKIHDNSFTLGYSDLITHEDHPAKFGYGAWYDKTDKDNKIYTERPAAADAAFAGILTRQVHIATGYPAKNDQIDQHNKGLLAKDGYVVYKTGHDPATGDEDMNFSDVEVGMLLCINIENGKFTFAETVPADHEVAGVVIAMNPDDKSWTCRLLAIEARAGAVPPGGTTGQALVKQSNADYHVRWVTL